MSKDDRNTAIIVAVVLVICTISLIVIGGYVWRLIAPGLTGSVGSVVVFVKVNNTNYNFPVPKKTAISSTGATFILPTNYTYNFLVPPTVSAAAGITGVVDESILSDARLQGYGNATVLTQANGFLSIPILNIAVPIYLGNVGNELNAGLWEYPLGNGLIFLCQRQYFAPSNPYSCWDLDSIKVGNEIFLNRGDQNFRYVVKIVTYLTNVEGFVYGNTEDVHELQLITSHPLEGGQDRLVITATPENID
jgi:sortase (surface protein transpeptidase)